jgi:hypothetical protein
MRKSNAAAHAGDLPANGKSTLSGIRRLSIIGKYYRGATDWVKPAIDKIVDPIAITIGANAALSIIIYYVLQEILQPAFYTMSGGRACSFIERHDWVEFILKAVSYCLIYGFANISVIIPVAVRLFRRTSVPSWKNHLKTWAIVAIAIFAWTRCGVKNDFDQIAGRIKTADGFFQTIGSVFSFSNIITIDKYMSGVKGTQIAVDTLLLFGRDSDTSIAEEVERECMRIRQKDIAISDAIVNDSKSLIEDGIIDNPAQLVYITRVVYFEGAYDPRARSLGDVKSGLAGIASVMYNRYLFDASREKNGLPRVFSKKGGNLFDVVFHYAPNRYGGVTWQFSAIPDNVSYFNSNESLTLASGKMNPDRTLLCYRALVDVLTERATDNTNAALFYQNPGMVDAYNRNWKDRGLDDVKKINSHVFFRPSNLSDGWRESFSM